MGYKCPYGSALLYPLGKFLAVLLLGCRVVLFLIKKFFFNVYSFFEIQRQSMSRGGVEREGDTESEAGFSLSAVSTQANVGLELTNCAIMP